MKDEQLHLLRRAKSGDSAALNALLDENKNRVYAIAFALLKNKEDAEDAMQQALITVWHSIQSLENEGAFDNWLYRITYTRSLNIYKARHNKDMILDRDLGDISQAEFLESELMLPQEYAEKNDLHNRLFAIIDSLSPVQRETVVLYYFHDKGVGEIAEIMDCSQGTVKSRLYLARNAIRTEIEEQERKSGQRFYGFAVGIIPIGRFIVENTAKTMLTPQVGAKILLAAQQAAFSAGTAAAGAASTAATGTAAATGGFPLGVKIAAVATGAVLAVSAAGIGVKLLMDNIRRPDAQSDNERTATVASTAPATTSAPTAPATTSAPTAPPLRAAYTAFLQALQADEQAVRDYDWQQMGYPSVNGSKSVAFADIMGDETPEMILTGCFGTDDVLRINALLKIYQFKDGTAQAVYTMAPDDELRRLDFADFKNVGPFTANYALYQRAGEKTLYLYAFGSEGLMDYSLIRSFDGNSVKTLARHTSDHTGSSKVNSYYVDEQAVKEEDFSARARELSQNCSTVLMLRSPAKYGAYRPGFDDIKNTANPIAKTYDEALTYLQQESSGQPIASALPVAGTYNVFINEAEHYSLTINENGQCACVYLLDGGFVNDVSKSRYSTMRCTVNNLQKTSGTTYSFTLGNRHLDQTPGTSGQERITNKTVTVTYAENGMDNDSELTVYQKGTPVSDLPENVRRKYQFELNRVDDAPIAYNLLYDSQNDLLFWENYGIDRYENSSL